MENTAAQKAINKMKYGFTREVSMGFDDAVEHTREVLREHGFSAEDIERLAAGGAVIIAEAAHALRRPS